MDNNKIKKIDNSIGNLLRLKILDLHYNPLRYLPNEICNLQNLQKLELMHSMISRSEKSIKNWFNALKTSNCKIKVYTFYLGNKKFTSFITLKKLFKKKKNWGGGYCKSCQLFKVVHTEGLCSECILIQQKEKQRRNEKRFQKNFSTLFKIVLYKVNLKIR